MKKKAGFIIDRISEDTFYENVLLGLPQFLKKSPFISRIRCERLPAVPLQKVLQWESKNIPLPEDIRNFFLSTNGFLFTYKFYYDGPEEAQTVVNGAIHVKFLEAITKMDNNQISTMTEEGPKFLSPASNVFVICDVDETSCVVLAQFNANVTPNYWLYAKGRDFYFLCNDFKTYLKMAVAHLGVSGWQLSAINKSFSEWTLEVYQILAPGICFKPTSPSGDANCKVNRLDCGIFEREQDEEANKDEQGMKTVKPVEVKARETGKFLQKPILRRYCKYRRK